MALSQKSIAKVKGFESLELIEMESEIERMLALYNEKTLKRQS